MAKNKTYYLDIRIDELTNSIKNTISGDSFDTEIRFSKIKIWHT